MGNHFCDARAVAGFVIDECRADIRIQHNKTPTLIFSEDAGICFGARFHSETDPAEKQGFYVFRKQLRHILGSHHPTRGIFIIKRIACLSIFQSHKGERGWTRRPVQIGCVDPAFFQSVFQNCPEKVCGHARQKADIHPLAPNSNGRVKNCTPCKRLKSHLMI